MNEIAIARRIEAPEARAQARWRCATAQRFLGERHVKECPCRFDVVAIDNHVGAAPELRLHKDAFSAHVDHW